MLLIKREVNRLSPVWEPFRDLRNMHDEMDRMFSTFWGGPGHGLMEAVAWTPTVDMYEEDNNLVVKAELPGLKKGDASVSLAENTLTIKGERKLEKEEKRDHYFQFESGHGRFQRVLRLPFPVKVDEVKAVYEEGVLKITLPKSEVSKTREIKIELN